MYFPPIYNEIAQSLSDSSKKKSSGCPSTQPRQTQQILFKKEHGLPGPRPRGGAAEQGEPCEHARTHAAGRDHGERRRPSGACTTTPHHPPAPRDVTTQPLTMPAITRAKESYLKLKIAATHQSYGTRCEQHRSVSRILSVPRRCTGVDRTLMLSVSCLLGAPRPEKAPKKSLRPVPCCCLAEFPSVPVICIRLPPFSFVHVAMLDLGSCMQYSSIPAAPTLM